MKNLIYSTICILSGTLAIFVPIDGIFKWYIGWMTGMIAAAVLFKI